jgi:hypothetical protein
MNGKSLNALLLMLVFAPCLSAQEVELAALGAFELAFESVQPVRAYPGRQVAATVTFRTGEAFAVPSPGRVQQIEYLVAPGAAVVQGQPFAVLRGPEMHHFEMSYESSRALLAGAERRYKANKSLYERKAISESRWLEISEKYYALSLEHEHMRHFFELVVEGDDDPDALILAAPLTGVIDYNPDGHAIQEGDSIALFVPVEAIRLEADLPNNIRDQVVALKSGDCELPVERVSGMSDGFFVQMWSAPVGRTCRLLLGQQVLATPLLSVEGAYSLPRSAVFQWQRQTMVLVREGDKLIPVPVSLLGVQGEDYVLASEFDLGDRDVLVSSVSAVQGVLLGLGGE